MSPSYFLRDLQSLVLILFICTPVVAAMTYEEFLRVLEQSDSRATKHENLDPAQANPMRNITCLGDMLHLRLPMLGDFDPNQVNVQKLCVKPQYNGGAPGQHAGGYCTEPPFTPYTGDIAFDVSSDARASKVLQNPRVLLACRYRCYCNWGVADSSVQPKTRLRPMQFKVQPRPSSITYQLQLDINDDFTTPRRQKAGQFESTPVDSLRLLTQSQVSREGRYIPRHNLYDYISLDPGNKIVCGGNMPTFDLPPPYTHVDFITQGPNPVQRLCAMQLSGGAKGANAGGYCHRSNTPDGPRSEVWFSDDMTPRLDWTWTAGNFFASAAIRFFCWQHCTCTTNPNKDFLKDNAAQYLWEFVPGHKLIQYLNGALHLETPGATGPQSIVQVLPPQQGAGSASGSCGVNGTDFCPHAWDERIYGPAPSVPPYTTDIVKPLNSANSTVCGNTCHSPADCGSTVSGYTCSCAFPSSDDARKLGLDPVAPAAVCLALFITTTQNRLGGRDTRSYVDATGLPHSCICNETFKGVECCGAPNGIRQAKLTTHSLAQIGYEAR